MLAIAQSGHEGRAETHKCVAYVWWIRRDTPTSWLLLGEVTCVDWMEMGELADSGSYPSSAEWDQTRSPVKAFNISPVYFPSHKFFFFFSHK